MPAIKSEERWQSPENPSIPSEKHPQPEEKPGETPSRRYDLDWIRVLVILMLIPFHSSMVFLEDEPFYVKNGQLTMAFDTFNAFLDGWGMHLLFLVAGAASWFALRNVTAGYFFKKKLLRLLLPLIFGVLVILPPIAYIARLTHSDYHEAYWQFYPRFFEFDPADAMGYEGHFSPGHLWFVVFLFVLSVIALPLFVWLKKESGKRFISWLAKLSEKPGIIFLWSIPLYLVDGFPDLGGDSRNLLKCLAYLIFGYILMSDPRFQETIDRQKFWALALAVSSTVVFLLVRDWGLSQESFSLGSSTFDLLHDFNSWTIMLMLFGFCHSYFNFSSKAWKYLNEASYPIYILHLTVIVVVGFYVVQWNLDLTLKYLITVFASYGLTFALYDLVVRRISIVRLLFGMKRPDKKG